MDTSNFTKSFDNATNRVYDALNRVESSVNNASDVEVVSSHGEGGGNSVKMTIDARGSRGNDKSRSGVRIAREEAEHKPRRKSPEREPARKSHETTTRSHESMAPREVHYPSNIHSE